MILNFLTSCTFCIIFGISLSPSMYLGLLHIHYFSCPQNVGKPASDIRTFAFGYLSFHQLVSYHFLSHYTLCKGKFKENSALADGVVAPHLRMIDRYACPLINMSSICLHMCLQSHLQTSPLTPQKSLPKFLREAFTRKKRK